MLRAPCSSLPSAFASHSGWPETSFFFFKQKTAYELSTDWSSDVCSSDLRGLGLRAEAGPKRGAGERHPSRGRRRSEERRVGQECRSRWSPYHEKKNKRSYHGPDGPPSDRKDWDGISSMHGSG